MTLAFLVLAGVIFLVVQSVQFVLGYTPLAVGFALLLAAAGLIFGTAAGGHLSSHVRVRGTVASGITIDAAGRRSGRARRRYRSRAHRHRSR